MAFYNSSSLVASERMHNLPRHRTGLLKNLKVRTSKQALTEKRMFGNRRGRHNRDLQIGKKFGKLKSSSISPDIGEFDDYMNKMTRGPRTRMSQKKYG